MLILQMKEQFLIASGSQAIPGDWLSLCSDCYSEQKFVLENSVTIV